MGGKAVWKFSKKTSIFGETVTPRSGTGWMDWDWKSLDRATLTVRDLGFLQTDGQDDSMSRMLIANAAKA